MIGIAVGTVLLPEMSRRIAAGDEDGAKHAQNRAIEFALVLSVPCLVAFVMVPDLIMRGLFNRGAFTAADAHGRRHNTRGLCDRAAAVRADAQRRDHVPGARRHRDAGQGAVRRRDGAMSRSRFC